MNNFDHEDAETQFEDDEPQNDVWKGDGLEKSFRCLHSHGGHLWNIVGVILLVPGCGICTLWVTSAPPGICLLPTILCWSVVERGAEWD